MQGAPWEPHYVSNRAWQAYAWNFFKIQVVGWGPNGPAHTPQRTPQSTQTRRIPTTRTEDTNKAGHKPTQTAQSEAFASPSALLSSSATAYCRATADLLRLEELKYSCTGQYCKTPCTTAVEESQVGMSLTCKKTEACGACGHAASAVALHWR